MAWCASRVPFFSNAQYNWIFTGISLLTSRSSSKISLTASQGKGQSNDEPQKILPKISQETLAEMIDTTRSRVSLFMNKFKKPGFIDNEDGLEINSSLLSVVLRD